MKKSNIPHIVKAKQPTIVNKDPFKTEKLEKGNTELFEKRMNKFFDAIKSKLKKHFESRELEVSPNQAITMKIVDESLEAFETDDLKLESWDFTKKGYIKGVQLGSQQMQPLGMDVSLNLGNKLSKKTLLDLQKKYDDKIDTWISNIQKQVQDIVYTGLEDGETLFHIIENLDDELKVGLTEAKRLATNEIIDAARRAEKDLYLSAGIEIYTWITVTDTRTCETCLALNGITFTIDQAGRGLVDFDTGQFLSDTLAGLTPDERFISPEDGKYGPPIHDWCRCHLAPVMTEDQYKGNVTKIVSEVEA